MENSSIAESGSGHHLVEKGSIFCGFFATKKFQQVSGKFTQPIDNFF